MKKYIYIYIKININKHKYIYIINIYIYMCVNKLYIYIQISKQNVALWHLFLKLIWQPCHGIASDHVRWKKIHHSMSQ